MGLKSFAARIRRRTWIIIGACAAVVIGGAATLVFAVVLPASAATAQPETITTTSAASLETLEKSVSTSGTLTPLVDETVDFADGVAGTVTSVAVVAGQTVAVDDTLAVVDTLQMNANLLEAQATLAEAQATLADATTDARVASAEASVAVAQTAVDDAQAALDAQVLTAPAVGVVTSVGIEVGDTVGSTSTGAAGGAGGAETTASTGAFTIVGTDAWRVDVTVGESDVALIAVGNQVELTTDDGTELFGTVTEIGLLPSTDSGSAAYPVAIDVTGTADGLYDGTSVTVAIVYERRTDVLTVPSAAVTTADGTSTVTLVAADGTETETTVEVGETVGNLTEILSGLAEGDEVLVASFTPGEGNEGGTFPGGGTGERPDFGGEGGQGGPGGTGTGGQGGFPGGTAPTR